MGSVTKVTNDGGSVTWQVRYREANLTQRKRSFDRKVDAERYLTTVEHDLLVGSYVDPSRSRVALEDWATQWIAGSHTSSRAPERDTRASCPSTSSRAGGRPL